MSTTKFRKNLKRSSSSSVRYAVTRGHEPSENSALLGPERIGDGELSWLAKDLQSVWQLLGSRYTNILLVIMPFGLLSGALNWHPIARFILNFLAIIPLQSLISSAMDELALFLGQVLGGLLNTILGTATELIVSIVALKANEIRIVQANIMGSVFSRVLLIPGACLFVGGLGYREQSFEGSIVSTMLFPTLASIMILVTPTALYSLMAEGFEAQNESNSLSLSCAIVLLLLHSANLMFQLKTHTDLLDDDVDATEEYPDSMEPNINVRTVVTAALSLPLTLVLITACAHNLVRSLPQVFNNSDLHRTFVGFVLLPFLGNAADDFTAIVVTCKNKPDLALGVCAGSIMQTVLFVMPVLVVIGAAINHPLTLYFGREETVAVLFATVLLAALLQKGTSNYLDGLLCLGLYSIVVLAFLFLSKEIHSPERGSDPIIMQILTN